MEKETMKDNKLTLSQTIELGQKFLVGSSHFLFGVFFLVFWFGKEVTLYEHNYFVLFVESLAWLFASKWIFYDEIYVPLKGEKQ